MAQVRQAVSAPMQQTLSTTDPRSGFEPFFRALWDRDPFSWQADLAQRVLERAEHAPGTPTEEGRSPWPDAIALPTASGKTACMDIAVYALAAQAARLESDKPITAPRRIFFVVDRRVIVDTAHERARLLASRLKAADDGILKTVADNLRRIAHGSVTGFRKELPLAAHAPARRGPLCTTVPADLAGCPSLSGAALGARTLEPLLLSRGHVRNTASGAERCLSRRVRRQPQPSPRAP